VKNFKSLFIFLMLVSGFSQSATISSDKQRISEDITLFADIDTGVEGLHLVNVEAITPIHQNLLWNKDNFRFNDLGFGFRFRSSHSQEVNIEIVDDYFSCQFGDLVVSKEVNNYMLANSSYSYRELNGNRIENNKLVMPLSYWQRVDSDKYVADVMIRATPPFISSEYLPRVRRVGGECTGNIYLIFSKD
jgi:hypothetical protein